MSKKSEVNRTILAALRLKSGESLSIKSLKGRATDDDVRHELHDSLTVPENALDLMYVKLVRWIESWRSDIITFDDFYTIKTEIAKFDPEKRLIDVSVELLEQRVSAMLSSNPIFVRQMKDIGLDEDRVMDGIDDYLRMQGRLAVWNSKKLIKEDDARDFTRGLRNYFAKQELEVTTEHQEWDAQRIGKMIYARCQMNHETKFKGAETLERMVEGGYQMLADQLLVGWLVGWQEKYKSERTK